MDVTSQFFSDFQMSTAPIDMKKIGLDRNDRIASGSFGTLYTATHSGTPVAVKELKIGAKDKIKVMPMIYSELKICEMARHPNITQFLGYAFDKEKKQNFLMIMLELIDGENLEDILEDEDLKKLRLQVHVPRAQLCSGQFFDDN